MHWYNPLISPAAGFQRLLVRVEKREQLQIGDQLLEVLRVEAVRSSGLFRQPVWTAWIDEQGGVQQYCCAIGPAWVTVRQEPFDGQAFESTQRHAD